MNLLSRLVSLSTILLCQVTTTIAQYDRIVWADLSTTSSDVTIPRPPTGVFLWSYLGNPSPYPSSLDERDTRLTFGLFTPANGDGIFLETWNKAFVGVDNGQNLLVTMLDEGVVIGPSNSWALPITDPIISTPEFPEWNGKSAYIGLQVVDKTRLHYGWIKVQVSANGQQITLQESAIHMTPRHPITTGDRGDDKIPTPHAITQMSSDLCIGITNVGRLGYIETEGAVDLDTLSCRYQEQHRGVGLIYRETNKLFFEAGLLIGVDENRVLSSVRGIEKIISQDMDFTQRLGSVMEVTQKGPDIMYGRVELTDEHAAHPIGLSVLQESFTYTQSRENGLFVILRYTIKNESQEAIEDLFAGLWIDWDLGTNFKANNGLIDRERNLGYVQSSSTVSAVAGIRILSEHPFSTIYNAVLGDETGFDDDPEKGSIRFRENKWKIMSGQKKAPNAVLNEDIVQITSVGPINISPGDEADVLFALVAGNSRQEILASSDRALAVAPTAILVASEQASASPALSSIISIDHIYPNPTIDQATLTFQLSSSAHVEVDVYDLLGRHVDRLLTGYMPSGLNEVTWNIDHALMPRGVYAIRWSVNNGAHKESQFVVVR